MGGSTRLKQGTGGNRVMGWIPTNTPSDGWGNIPGPFPGLVEQYTSKRCTTEYTILVPWGDIQTLELLRTICGNHSLFVLQIE